MELPSKYQDGSDEDRANNDLIGNWANNTSQRQQKMEYSNLRDMTLSSTMDTDNHKWEEEGATTRPNESLEDDKRTLSKLKNLSMASKPPLPDFQFELLDSEADTDGSGCEQNLATGTRRKHPKRADSWEDNWLFQKRTPKSQSRYDGRDALPSPKMHKTIDELPEEGSRDNSDTSLSNERQIHNEVRRVQRPCVLTSSSSSASDDSELLSSDEPNENNGCQENECEDKIPILEGNYSTMGTIDSSKSQAQTPVNLQLGTSEDEVSCKSNTYSRRGSKYDLPKVNFPEEKQEDEGLHTMNINQQAEVARDDSIKTEVTKFKEDNASFSRSENPLLPILIARHTPSPGTRSCTSEDSGSDEFEKRAAAYKPRRRASWCYLEKPSAVKKKGKRRHLLHLRPDEEPVEPIKVPPLVNKEEALEGLERQMLHRNVHHSSFRSKKASPNFVVNPLYIPDGNGSQDLRRDPIEEPVEAHQLRPQRYESGYSSCSPDSFANHSNHNSFLNTMRCSSAAGRLINSTPEEPNNLNSSSAGQSHAKSDQSFLW